MGITPTCLTWRYSAARNQVNGNKKLPRVSQPVREKLGGGRGREDAIVKDAEVYQRGILFPNCVPDKRAEKK